MRRKWAEGRKKQRNAGSARGNIGDAAYWIGMVDSMCPFYEQTPGSV